MRIRKNTKLSSMLLATAGYGGERVETYVCHLNQSPWDVIPLSSSGDADADSELTNLIDSSWFLPSPPLIHQFDTEDSFNGNVSLGDSAERLISSIENNRSVERVSLIAGDDCERSPDVEDPMDRSDNSYVKATEPNSPVKTSGDDDQVAVSMPAPPKRGRPRGTTKKSPASTGASRIPYEFYYYSGFGPRWGRKRCGSGDEKTLIGDNKTAAFGDGSGSFDYAVEDFELIGEDSDHGKKKMTMTEKVKKRGRKPVKERSLKSLM